MPARCDSCGRFVSPDRLIVIYPAQTSWDATQGDDERLYCRPCARRRHEIVQITTNNRGESCPIST